jgi:hypothetical protein
MHLQKPQFYTLRCTHRCTNEGILKSPLVLGLILIGVSFYFARVSFEFSVLAAAYVQEQLLGKCFPQNITKSELLSHLGVSDANMFHKVRDHVTYTDPRTMRGTFRYLELFQLCLRAIFKETNIWVSDSFSPVHNASFSSQSKSGNEKGTSHVEGMLALTDNGLYRPGTRYDRTITSSTPTGSGSGGDAGSIASINSGDVVSDGNGQWVAKSYQVCMLSMYACNTWDFVFDL